MKCLTLCLILVSGSWAQEWTQVLLGWGDPQAGLPTDLTVLLVPTTITAGTVSFTSNGQSIAGCKEMPLKDTPGRVVCRTSFPKVGTYSVEASYSGATGFTPASTKKNVPVRTLIAGAWIERNPDLKKEAYYGNNIILGALLLGPTGAIPTGTFRFTVDGKDVGTPSVSEDKAAEDFTGLSAAHAQVDVLLPVGNHVAQAFYSGDERYRTASTPPMSFTVYPGDGKIAISATPAQVSQKVVVTASVTALNPTGAFTFDRMPGCENVPIDSKGFAQCTTTWSQFGDFPITARYSGDRNLNPGSATMWVKVSKANAGIFMAKEPERPVYGQKVKVSALVMGAQGLSAPVGSITFTDGAALRGTSGFDGEGRASWTVELPAGSRTISAAFTGDMFYAASQGSIPVTVAKADTTTTMETAGGGAFTATVRVVAPGAGTPTGNVRFRRDGNTVATVGLTGATASFTTTAPGAITADYLGDANFNASGSTWSVATAAVLVSLTSNRNPSMPGQSVTLITTVTPNPGTSSPSGTVRFTSDGVTLGTVGLSAGRASLTATFPAGPHAIVAEYSGDATYPATASSLTQIVTAAQAGLGLTASVPSSVYGQSVTFTARLSAADAAGTVKFTDGTVALGSVQLSGGVASLTVGALPAGSHRISASWAGDTTYGGASSELTYTVAKAPTTVLVNIGTGAASAKVVPVAPGSGVPTGALRFVDLLLNATLGGATVVLAGLTGPVRAIYDGDDNFAAAASEAVNPVTVANAASYAADMVAPEELVTLFGPITAGITTAKITDSAGESREAQVLFSGPGQATLVLPANIGKGPALVTAGWWTSAVTIGQTAPGLFTADYSGKGAPAGITEPIDAGSTVVLYGTGIRNWTEKPVCTIGGDPVQVVYAGAQGEFPGLDQVNLFVPESMKGVGSTVLDLVIDGIPANRLAITVR